MLQEDCNFQTKYDTVVLLKEIVPYIIKIMVDLGNKLLFAEVPPQVDKYFHHRLVIFVLKAGKNAMDPDSYRGLSLLEGVYKIYAKILARRIQVPIKKIQHCHQFGFTKIKLQWRPPAR